MKNYLLKKVFTLFIIFIVCPTLLMSQTTVNFKEAEATINETDGTYLLVLSIVSPDVSNDTTVDVALLSGNAGDINNYSLQTVTFPANDGTDQSITLTITDDAIVEVNQSLRFELINVLGGNSAIIGQNSTFNLTITDDEILNTGDIIINEIMYDPASSPEEEWIEFKNTTSKTIDLGGFYITDDNVYPSAGEGDFIISANTELGAGDYLVVMTSNRPDNAEDIPNELLIDSSTGFQSGGLGSLANGGDNIALYSNADGSGFLIDGSLATYYTDIASNGGSIERNLSGNYYDQWQASTYPYDGFSVVYGTPGFENSNTARTYVNFKDSDVTVNEEDGTYTIELSIVSPDMNNDTTVDVLLSNGNAEDINNYSTQTVTFPANDGSNQSVILTLTDDDIVEVNQILGFELTNVLGGNNAIFGHKKVFDLTITDDEILNTGDIIINEIMYDPASSPEEEWIEFKNTTSKTIDLGGFYITDDDVYPAEGEGDFVIPANTELNAGGFLVVMTSNRPDNAEDISNELLIDVSTGFQSGGLGSLANSGDNIALYSNAVGSGILIDGSLTTYYTDAASNGGSIERNESGNYEDEWQASTHSYGGSSVFNGTPGFENSTSLTAGDSVENNISNLLYPNPTTGLITINIAPSQVSKLTLLDFTGRKLMSVQNQNTLNISQYEVGSYLLMIECLDYTIVRSVVKI